MTLGVGGVDVILHHTFLYSLKEAAFLFNLQEDFPTLVGERRRKLLDIIAAGSGVNHLVEVAFLLEQQLLVAGETL